MQNEKYMISYFKQKGDLSPCEDSLTATVFDNLKYLPSEVFWQILKNALYFDKLPFVSGEIESIHYWPHWNPKYTFNVNFVEPDLFIRFHTFDVILEAKRYDNNQQYEGQKENQIKSYYNEYEKDGKKLFYIQVGGLNDRKDESNYYLNNYSVVICKTDWSRLLIEIQRQYNLFKTNSSSVNKAICRILEDLIFGFSLHGYIHISWLKDLKKSSKINYKPLTLFEYAK